MLLANNWRRCEYFKLNIFAEFLHKNVCVYHDNEAPTLHFFVKLPGFENKFL